MTLSPHAFPCHHKVIHLDIKYQRNQIDGEALSGFSLMSHPTGKI